MLRQGQILPLGVPLGNLNNWRVPLEDKNNIYVENLKNPGILSPDGKKTTLKKGGIKSNMQKTFIGGGLNRTGKVFTAVTAATRARPSKNQLDANFSLVGSKIAPIEQLELTDSHFQKDV